MMKQNEERDWELKFVELNLIKNTQSNQTKAIESEAANHSLPSL